MIKITTYEINKALFTFKLQDVLSRFDALALERAYKKLFDDYHCYLPDCYDNPIVLGKILKEIFGSSNHGLVLCIHDPLREFSTQPKIAEHVGNLTFRFVANSGAFVN